MGIFQENREKKFKAIIFLKQIVIIFGVSMYKNEHYLLKNMKQDLTQFS